MFLLFFYGIISSDIISSRFERAERSRYRNKPCASAGGSYPPGGYDIIEMCEKTGRCRTLGDNGYTKEKNDLSGTFLYLYGD